MLNPARFPEAEHQTEPILGWRAWRLHRIGPDLRIVPTTPRPPWEPRVAIRASCTGAHTRLYLVFNPELAPQHRSPMPGCTCGIHAIKDPARLTRSGRTAAVVGRIAMWGRVIEHTRGWRAELAYPSRLRLVCSWCLWYGRLPAIPERVFERAGVLRPACAEHAARPGAVGTTLEVGEVQQELLDAYGIEPLPVEAFRPLDESRPVGALTRLLQAFDRGIGG
ncbi:MAG TPA: hypothetical protein VE669_12295 [Actinomycetota bacterium]|nr:hypothetical protein [Actinomycetota bacterium]